jgi:HAD superfamily phosphatase (TIGR01668 family)
MPNPVRPTRMSLLSPDHYVRHVSAIDLEALRAEGVNALLVDLDNTLLPRDTPVFSREALDFADRVRATGMRACLVSNNWHARVHGAAEELGFELVPRALKPLPFAFRKALRLLGVEAGEAAVIGDQLFTDILGGNLIGARTILVCPLSATDLPHTLLLRSLEAGVLKGREPLA